MGRCPNGAGVTAKCPAPGLALRIACRTIRSPYSAPRNGATCGWVDLPPHGTRVGEVRFPDGELDLSGVCRPGEVHRLSLRVTAMPLQAVLQSYTDSAAAREVKGAVARRGLCGDVHLIGGPRGPRPGGVRVSTSVWRGEPLEWFGIVRSEVKLERAKGIEPS